MAIKLKNESAFQFKKDLGQVMTPELVARAMVAWASSQYTTKSFLDPGVGTGIFTQELFRGRKRNRVGGRICAVCVDIDPEIISQAQQELGKNNSIKFLIQDFLKYETDERFQAIVCNPPYLKHHKIEDKVGTIAVIERLTGQKLPVTTNTYGLFLVRARALLADIGRCAFIVPSEFLNSDFGKALKSLLIADSAFRGIVAFDFRNLVFTDALTTSCIILFDTNTSSADQFVRFVELTHPEQLEATLNVVGGQSPDGRASSHVKRVERNSLNPSRKWKAYFREQADSAPHKLVPLKAYATCSRGIATGANGFFTLSEKKRLDLGLDTSDLQECITRSADAPGFILSKSDYENLKKTDSRIYLLNPRMPLTKPIQEYLKLGEALGIPKMHLPAHRPRWFCPERQLPADIWVMVFSRGRTRFVWNKADINHLTTFHGIYLNLFGRSIFPALLLYLWSSHCQRALEEQQRQYGAGLQKYEPRDIENILVPDFSVGPTIWIEQAAHILEELEGSINRLSKEEVITQIDRFFLDTWLSTSNSVLL